MNGLMNFLEEKLVPLAAKLGSNRYLKAISGGFVAVLSATIVGSMFVLIGNLPIKAYTDWLASSGFGSILALPGQVTTDLIALYAAFFIAYTLAKEFQVDGTGAGLSSLVSFMLVTGRVDGAISVEYLGAKGLFGAMLIALIAGRIYVYVIQHGWTIKLPDSVPPNVANSFSALIPTFIVVIVFLIVAGLMTLTSYGNLQVAIFTVIQQQLMRFMGNNIFAYVFFNLMANLLWFFGLHGGNITGSITSPIYTPLGLENLALYQAGQEPINIISPQLTNCFTFGGVGSMFSLAILMTFLSKSEQFKTLGKLSLPTTFFFINEPLIFGIPVVLNPLFFIPLIFLTPIMAFMTYGVMSIGLIPIPNGVQIPWTTPPIISGFLIGDGRLVIWQILMILFAMAAYFPFFKVADKRAYEEEQGKVSAS